MVIVQKYLSTWLSFNTSIPVPSLRLFVFGNVYIREFVLFPSHIRAQHLRFIAFLLVKLLDTWKQKTYQYFAHRKFYITKKFFIIQTVKHLLKILLKSDIYELVSDTSPLIIPAGVTKI